MVETHHLLHHIDCLNVNHTALVVGESPLRQQVVLQLNKARREVAPWLYGYDSLNVNVLVEAHHQFHYHLLCQPGHLDNMKKDLSVALAHALADGESNRLNVVVTVVRKTTTHISL